ncbi:hypothetical protein P378_13720 [Desulforamulus profundi]|uniref:Uncharacterized protein n=1 Tax=Desulforamulus profundi TaxID=1383067 RepID=A0A2C6L253_9FIRM|nr:hypothetical protein P378_18060 [Desulforamulus profundi]PHJ37811.1 hypothetical protein P378_13720 [Desulforamulus profundi]
MTGCQAVRSPFNGCSANLLVTEFLGIGALAWFIDLFARKSFM